MQRILDKQNDVDCSSETNDRFSADSLSDEWSVPPRPGRLGRDTAEWASRGGSRSWNSRSQGTTDIKVVRLTGHVDVLMASTKRTIATAQRGVASSDHTPADRWSTRPTRRCSSQRSRMLNLGRYTRRQGNNGRSPRTIQISLKGINCSLLSLS